MKDDKSGILIVWTKDITKITLSGQFQAKIRMFQTDGYTLCEGELFVLALE